MVTEILLYSNTSFIFLYIKMLCFNILYYLQISLFRPLLDPSMSLSHCTQVPLTNKAKTWKKKAHPMSKCYMFYAYNALPFFKIPQSRVKLRE